MIVTAATYTCLGMIAIYRKEPVTETHASQSASTRADASDAQLAERDAELLYIGNTGTVEFDLTLPTRGANGSGIIWSSSDDRWIRPDGAVRQPEYGRGDRDVTLTATVRHGEATATRAFHVRVLEQANRIRVSEVFPIDATVRAGASFDLPMYTAVRADDGRLLSQRIDWQSGTARMAGPDGWTGTFHGVIDRTDIPVTATVHARSDDPAIARNRTSDAAGNNLVPIPLSHVRLTGDGVLAGNQARRLAFLRTVDNDRLLVEFRRASGLDTRGAQAMTGWDAPDSLLRGHTTGHCLSAYALAYATSGDGTIKRKLDYVVDSLAEVQRAFSAKPGFHPGFLSAYAEDQFDQLERYVPYPTIWAPYYTLHKILAGLLDAWRWAGNRTALDVATGIGDWVYARLSRLPHEQLQRMWGMYIAGEFGGMNESLADLYGFTHDPGHLAAARLFDNDRLMVPMRQRVDALGGLHANQHIPQVIGWVTLARAIGESRDDAAHYLEQTRFFCDAVLAHHLYAMGGTGKGEMFHQPDVIGALLADDTAESCATYNMLKLTAALAPYATADERRRYADFAELATVNHIAASTDHAPEGGSTYFMPTQPGGHKDFDADENSCCHGTGLESHFYYAQGVYYVARDGDSTRDAAGRRSALIVTRYLNGTLRDPAADLDVMVRDEDPGHVTIDVKRLAVDALRLHVPAWSVDGQGRPKANVRVDGEPIEARYGTAGDGGELVITPDALGRDALGGMRIELAFAPRMRLIPAPDRPELAAVTWGPYVLAALCDHDQLLDVPVDAADPDAAFERKPGTLRFTHRSAGLMFVPLFAIDRDRPYHLYVRTQR
ncbi:beta-L-arabinofuranosidase domain-containing protein [Bifidobacterium vespertilionis]|nr:beta-L-arabinofuranosidase domain-containing protein [Bifidobacterium vespertilionis]